jgi:hypothetical protein
MTPRYLRSQQDVVTSQRAREVIGRIFFNKNTRHCEPRSGAAISDHYY